MSIRAEDRGERGLRGASGQDGTGFGDPRMDDFVNIETYVLITSILASHQRSLSWG